jgi:predicted amidophosphoribosyltransferase
MTKLRLPLFFGCVRCARKNCLGLCENLSQFNSITCPFTLSQKAGSLLNFAKNSQHTWAQFLLESAAHEKTLEALGRLISTHSNPAIFLQSTHFSRIWNTHWHPNFWMQKLILKNFSTQIWNPEIPMSWSFVKDKNSQLSIQARKEKIQESLAQDFAKEVTMPAQSASCVIFVDDVLTTGLSALETYYSKQGRIFAHLPWHVFTLFRTPQENN